jgi:HEPN domain-containing protein
MTDFTKTKMHFALALIGTMFALHPLLDKHWEWGFRYPYVDFDFKVVYVYSLLAGLLAFAVYCYAIGLLSERPASRFERLGNLSYALAILVLPLYGGLYLTSYLAETFGQAHIAIVAPAAAAGLGVVWLGVAWWLRKRLGDQDRRAKMEQLVNQEIAALNRAPELFNENHYDLAVIEAWKAIEARLRRVLLQRGITRRLDNPQKMIDLAARLGIVKDTALKLLHDVRKEWNIAVSTEPLTREAAESALTAARHILSTIAVEPAQRSV